MVKLELAAALQIPMRPACLKLQQKQLSIHINPSLLPTTITVEGFYV
jgi:hypothetical protein